MKNLFLFFLFFISTCQLIAQNNEAVTGTIIIKCPDGQLNGSDGTCLFEVKFYAESSLTLEQAKSKATENGWTLASAEEVIAAFDKLNLDKYAYGRLSDGSFAVPVQSDYSNFKKGVNLNAQGGNQGFFYTIKPKDPMDSSPTSSNNSIPENIIIGTATVTEIKNNPPSNPPNTSNPANGGTLNINTDPPMDEAAIQKSLEDFYKQEFFRLNGMPYEGSQSQKYNQLEAKYKNGVGNIMQDKWDDPRYQRILHNALGNYIYEKFPNRSLNTYAHLSTYLRDIIKNKSDDCTDCQLARYEFVGFFVPEYLKMLRTGSDPQLQEEFAEYVSYKLARANRISLADWKYYSRRNSAQLATEPNIPGLNFNDNSPVLADYTDFGSNTTYDNVTISSVFINTAVPLPGKSVDEFKENYMGSSPFFFSPEKRAMLSDFIIPVTSHSYAKEEGVDDMMARMPYYLTKNLTAEAKALNLVGTHFTRLGTGVATGGAVIAGGFTLFLIHTAKESATHAANAASSIAQNALTKAQSEANATKLIAERAAKKALSGLPDDIAKAAAEKITHKLAQDLAEEAAKKAASAGAKIAITNTTKLGSKAIGPLLTNSIGPIASGIGIFVAGFMPTGGKAIEIAKFENKLKEDCYIKDRTKDWMALTDTEKIENFSFLFQMLVLDAPGFTYLMPDRVAGLSEQRKIEEAAVAYLVEQDPSRTTEMERVMSTMDTRYYSPQIHYYLEDLLSMEAVQSKINFHDWSLVTAEEIYDAWNGGFQAFAYLRMADGRFAVPIQEDISTFKTGPNIGVEGGNQGFFYKVDESKAKRIQNYWKKDMYIQHDGTSAKQGGKSKEGLDKWRVIPHHNGWFRLQSLNNPELYLNYSGTKLEVVKIEPNWVSALWKLHPTSTGYSLLQNKWEPDKYVHNQNGKLELGYTKPGWWSAMWKIE